MNVLEQNIGKDLRRVGWNGWQVFSPPQHVMLFQIFLEMQD